MPIFWEAPSSYPHAAADIGSAVEWLRSCFTLSSDENGCLAVLRNRNRMVSTFGSSEWVTQSALEKCYFLCWNDGAFGASCPDQGWLSQLGAE